MCRALCPSVSSPLTLTAILREATDPSRLQRETEAQRGQELSTQLKVTQPGTPQPVPGLPSGRRDRCLPAEPPSEAALSLEALMAASLYSPPERTLLFSFSTGQLLFTLENPAPVSPGRSQPSCGGAGGGHAHYLHLRDSKLEELEEPSSWKRPS